MAIIEVLKQGNVDGNDIKYKKNEAKPKIKSADKSISLSNLNQKSNHSYNFSNDSNSELSHGRLKTERGIVGTIYSTIFLVFIISVIICGITYAIFKIFNLDFAFFEEKKYYSLEVFNSKLGMFLLTLLFLILSISFLYVFLINIVVKTRFKKRYLSKTNVYVYDAFLCMFNVFIFTIIGVIFFFLLDGYYNEFIKWINEGIIEEGVNLSIISVFKYLISVIVALFMSLNSIRGISITYKKNEFVFRNHL